jgi:hypothetical protein
MPYIGLELQTAFAIEQQVFGEPGPILPEALVNRIFAHNLEPTSDRREQIIEVILALSVVELATRAADIVATAVAVGVKDVACLKKNLRDDT